jgi:REP element-mobilizing transposase RayT
MFYMPFEIRQYETDTHLLRNVIRKVKTMHPFYIDAMVILPNHLYALWTLPEDDREYPTRWMLIKARLDSRDNSRKLNGAARAGWQKSMGAEFDLRGMRDSVNGDARP